MKNIRIEHVADINSDYPYLEVFLKEDFSSPFLEVSISPQKELSFTFYSSKTNIQLKVEDWEYILEKAKSFLPAALKNEEDFLKSMEKEE